MQKIGIITIVRVNNYGAELQAFALQKKLEFMGYQSELIDYLFYKHPDHKPTKASKPWVPLSLQQKIKEWLYPIIYKIKTRPYRKQKSIRESKFEAFHSKYTRFSKARFYTLNGLYQNQLPYNIFIVGSDQVWNPGNNTNLDPYFLTFAPALKKRVSYASSFGVSEIPNSAVSRYKSCLQQFDAIAVREKQGIDLVAKVSGKEATHVLDPTLLLAPGEWDSYAVEPTLNKPFVLLYILSSSSEATLLASKIAFQEGFQVVRICKEAVREDKNPDIINVTDAGPSEFLGWIKKASLVITNSFHGTAFAINFNIPFYTLVPAHKANNSRQQSLLSILKLEHRMLSSSLSFRDNYQISLDFSEANALLETEKEKSIRYLRNAIES